MCEDSARLWYNTSGVGAYAGQYKRRDDALISSPSDLLKRNIESFYEFPQFIDALENDDVPTARALLDTHPTFVSTAITPELGEAGTDYPIHLARSTEMIQLLVSRGADVNAAGECNQTALHNTHDLDVARILVSLGASVNGIPENNFTPLHLQVERPDIVEFLISEGADVNARSYSGRTPLHETAEYDLDYWRDVYSSEPIEEVEEYLRQALVNLTRSAILLINSGTDSNAVDDFGQTALHIASRQGVTDVAKLLLDSGADINAQAHCGETPLHYAARHGKEEIVKVLLASGANVNIRSTSRWYPLEMAMMHDHVDIVDLLVQHGARPPKAGARLFHAIYQRNIEQSSLLISHRPNLVKTRDDWRRTPLHAATRHNFPEGAKLLLDAGADPYSMDDIDHSPISIAVDQGNLELLKMLVGAGPRNEKHLGKSLMAALRRGNAAMARLLIESSAEFNVSPGKFRNETPLHLAVAKTNLEVVKALVDKGADVNAKGKQCRTPICSAVYRRKISIIKFLLDSGADVNGGTRGNSLVAAVRSGDINVLIFLINAGADIRGTGWHGISPLHEAVLYERPDMINALLDAGAPVNARLREPRFGVFRVPIAKGTTPFGLALMAGKREAEKLLRKRGGSE